MPDLKDRWIQTLVPGKSFMDVGGLWGTRNEKVSVALLAGAREATMADIAPLGHPLWQDFDERCRQLGVSGYGRRQLDVVELPADRASLVHDIVHCSGIIYHVPDPYRMLANLRAIAGEYLILTSMVVPERIDNTSGMLESPADRATFVPALTEATRATLSEHFNALGLSIGGINVPLTEPWRWGDGSPNFGPWWWLMSPSFLRGLLQVAGFVVADECWSWESRSYSFLAQRIAQ